MDRDTERRAQVDAFLARGDAKTSADYFYAAMVWEHGSAPADIERAHDLALKAMAIEPVHPKARWLAAASEDRVHMFKEEPQRFGTQFRVENGTWVLYKYDPSVTDEERAKWGVPPIAEAQKRVAILNETMPPPKDLDFRDAGAPGSGVEAAYNATLGRFLSERLNVPTAVSADAQRTLCAIYEVKISRTMVVWHVAKKATKPSGNDVFDEAAHDVFVRLMNDKTTLPAPPKSLDDRYRGRSASVWVLGKNASPGLCIPIK